MARLRSIILICIIIPLVASQCSKRKSEPLFRRSVYEFSIDLLTRLNQDNDGHFVASTLSPWALLTAVSFGASGNTLNELKKVLGLHTHRCFNKMYLSSVKDVISGDSDAVLERSASMFIADSMQLKAPFRTTLTNTGVCDITTLSFEDLDGASAVINDYVRRATHGVIEDIVTASDLENVYFLMIDALFFKGSWSKAFSVEDTEYSAFYDSHNNPTGDVNLMFVNGVFNVTILDIIKSTVLELPYGDTGRYSMLVILPDEGVTLTSVLDNMKSVSLPTIFKMYALQGPVPVSVQLPRFKLTSDIDNLKELLTDMGLSEAFDQSRASFPDISSYYEVYVSSFIQKADIEVTEEGTVAGAATDLSLSARSAITPMSFFANRPFLFMIVDRHTEVPVFSGAYSKPSVY